MPVLILRTLLGSFTITLLTLNTVFWSLFLFPATFLKVILPFNPFRNWINRLLGVIAHSWIYCNNIGLRFTRKIEWEVSGVENLSTANWYLVIANHQSWTDIVVLQKIFYKKIPFLKFFLKKELIWVPILGVAWWAFDFPFMKRFSKAFLEKNPHLAGKDIEITKKACHKFKHIPVSIMNFVEGTRLTPEKHARQQSPYPNLLKPKSGGIGFVFSIMGEQLTSILNVTIAYPGGPYSFWDFLCGRVKKVIVDVEEMPVTKDLIGDYINDPVHKEWLQKWMNDLWQKKSEKLSLLLDETQGAAVLPGSRGTDRDAVGIRTIN
ncbi:MAG TPA: acyltransferase [Spirochaetota bacterium]|nr:acyltransferase [Spirochaetota bacterium]